MQYQVEAGVIYLASQSPRRKEILEKLGIPFKVISSRYQEKKMNHLTPYRHVIQHALGKVRLAEVPAKARFVLGADTLVIYQGKVLGKPKDMSEAFDMVSMLSGQAHHVYTGVVLRDCRTKKIQKGYAKTKVWMKKFTPAQIRHYLKRAHPLDKAGSYAIQAKPKIVDRIEGSYSNVVGLPVELLQGMLKNVFLTKS